MKKIIIALIAEHYDTIFQNWYVVLEKAFGSKLSKAQIKTLVKRSIETISDVIKSTDFSKADEYLIEIYNLCIEFNLDLLEVSQIFSSGRFSIINHLEKAKYDFDPVIILGFIEEIFEQIFARYSVLHQETKMKELELDRDRLRQKLDMNQQYLKNILHSSDSAIMVLDADDKFLSWNKGAEKIFGFTEDEVLGTTPERLFPSGKNYQDELEFIRESVRTKGFYKTLETERLTKTGEIITVQLSVNILTDTKGNYAGRFVILKDYTEIKKLQQQIDQSEKLAVVGQMAAGIAHEIGNPLTSISSLVQILQRKTNEEFTSQQLANIREHIDRISKIVRELVDFSRPPGYEKSYVKISDIVKTALGIVKYDKRIKAVDFESDIDENIPEINVIPDQLLQVFVNILFNALDAVSGVGKICVKVYTDLNNVIVKISDNGGGIPKENLTKIFNPFFTTKTVGKGTGLGLSISYGIIKKFNGDIKVKSTEKKGSEFTIILPLENKN